uniref:Uncharacterized protein n=1 Tax=Arundo donax TaxID=35708 RepID=A0A0A9BM65_ARUDO
MTNMIKQSPGYKISKSNTSSLFSISS